MPPRARAGSAQRRSMRGGMPTKQPALTRSRSASSRSRTMGRVGWSTKRHRVRRPSSSTAAPLISSASEKLVRSVLPA